MPSNKPKKILVTGVTGLQNQGSKRSLQPPYLDFVVIAAPPMSRLFHPIHFTIGK